MMQGENMQQEKGYLVALSGVVLTLLWIGVFKFTPTEAEAIRPLVESHPLMNWMFSILSVQGVSNLIGITEIIVAIGMVVGVWKPKVGYWSGLAAVVIFITTLSFLFTLSGVWKIVDGVPVTEFFIFKDVVFLGVAWLSVERSHRLMVI
jgi:reactive chlorine resistance protein C